MMSPYYSVQLRPTLSQPNLTFDVCYLCVATDTSKLNSMFGTFSDMCSEGIFLAQKLIL